MTEPNQDRVERWLLGALLTALLAAGCATVPEVAERSPVDSAVFRGEWFDYYNRGLRRLRQGNRVEAQADLLEALAFQPGDSHYKRTYGVHFQTYYPHRELGILAFEDGQTAAALEHLEFSLRQAPSSRAMHFLNEARRQRIRTEGLDTRPPDIQTMVPSEGWLTNQRIFELSGRVSDDTFVSRILINDEEEFIELAEPEIAFRSRVMLHGGKNTVHISALDLGGRWSQEVLEVELDVEGPSLAFDEVRMEKERVWLSGRAYDPGGVAEGAISGSPLEAGREEIRIRDWYPLEPNQTTLDYYLRDRCGNENRGRIDLRQLADHLEIGALPNREGILVASLALTDALEILIARAVADIPEFDFAGLSSGRKVYQEEFFLDGTAYSPKGIQEIRLNGEPLAVRPGREIHFSYLARLKPGENRFAFEAKDSAGQVRMETLELTHEPPAARRMEGRLHVAVYDFSAGQSVPALIPQTAQAKFLREIKNRSRFNIYERERLQQILLEQGIAAAGLTDKKQRPRLAQITPADLLLFGEIIDASQGMDVYLDVVDAARPDQPVAVLNVYHPRRDIEQLGYTLKGLYLKLADEFPLLEGQVLRLLGDEVLTSLNQKQRVRPGLRLYAVREGEHVVEQGIDYGTVELDVGLLEVKKVDPQKSYASVLQLEPDMQLQRGDYVITE